MDPSEAAARSGGGCVATAPAGAELPPPNDDRGMSGTTASREAFVVSVLGGSGAGHGPGPREGEAVNDERK